MTADEFKHHLKALGLSQRHFAAEVGISVSTVNKWAKGRAPITPIAAAYVEVRVQLREARFSKAALAEAIMAG